MKPIEVTHSAVCPVASNQPWSADIFFTTILAPNRGGYFFVLFDEGHQLRFALNLDAERHQVAFELRFGFALLDANSEWKRAIQVGAGRMHEPLAVSILAHTMQFDAVGQEVIDNA